jgi:RNA polymerase sigma factor (sigma-70 family)
MDDVAVALDGDREALERLVRALEPQLHRLAVRFFAHPQTAEDATQEALVQIVTKLDRFDGRSEFSTWAYRVATNRFLSMARSPAERMAMTLEEFSDDLATIPVVENPARFPEVDEALLAEEVKISCNYGDAPLPRSRAPARLRARRDPRARPHDRRRGPRDLPGRLPQAATAGAREHHRPDAAPVRPL